MGAWACQACADRLGLDGAGNATAERGLCGAGGHEAREVITWYDGLSETVRTRIVEPQDLSPSLTSRCAEVGYDNPVNEPTYVVVHPQIAADLARPGTDVTAVFEVPLTAESQLDMFGPNREPLRGGA